MSKRAVGAPLDFANFSIFLETSKSGNRQPGYAWVSNRIIHFLMVTVSGSLPTYIHVMLIALPSEQGCETRR